LTTPEWRRPKITKDNVRYTILASRAVRAVTPSLSGFILTDSAIFSAGFFPTGSIVFTLSGPGGFAFTETDTVTGNGTYTANATLAATATTSAKTRA
jgi:hypothetical protein